MALHVAASLEDGPAKEAKLVDLHARRADAFAAIGQWGDQIHEARQALDHLSPEARGRRAELLLTMADAAFYLLDIPAVERHAAEALRLAEQVRRADIAADAVGWLGRCRQASGDLPGAIEMDRTARAHGPGRRGVSEKHGALSLYLAGHSRAAVDMAAEAVRDEHRSRDIEFTMYALSHYGLALGSAGRYGEAADAFAKVRETGRKYGVKGPLARGITMSGGFRLDLFDLAEAEAIAFEARELAQGLAFAPSLVSATIDLLYVFARRHEPGKAEHLLDEATRVAASTPGWHEWLWNLRLTQARAELALAAGVIDQAVSYATDAIAQARAVGRPKYEALAFRTRADAHRVQCEFERAIDDARSGEAAARRTGNPALLLALIGTVLSLAGSDELLAEARGLHEEISRELPDPAAALRFRDSPMTEQIRQWL
jgi:tetratricopeptide (TPR) repeat protein